jgi:hypothetical protein
MLSASALACSLSPHVYKVPRSFSVRVKNDLGPVAGLTLKVTFFKGDEYNALTDEQRRSVDVNRFEETVAESSTDADGTARFKLDRIGAFTLSPESPASQLDWVELEVPDQPPSPAVELHLPSVAVLKTAYLRGRLSRGLFSSCSTPLKRHELKLHTLVDYREVAGTTTDDDGAFDFRGISPGLYFLQLVPTTDRSNDFNKSEGNIAVYVSPDNSRENLMISTDNTSCGLSYDLDENKEQYKPEVCFKGGKRIKCDY